MNMSLFGSWRKYLLLIPIALLITDVIYFRNALNATNDALLREKYDEVVNFVDMMASTVDDDVKKGRNGYETTVINNTEYIDKLPSILAVAYRMNENREL